MESHPKPKLMHVMGHLNRAGTELGLLTLIEHGFYKDFDLRVVSLVRASGDIQSEMARHIGPDNVRYILDQPDPRPHDALKFWKGLSSELSSFSPSVAIFSDKRSLLLGRLITMQYPETRVVAFEHFARDFEPLRHPKQIVRDAILSITSFGEQTVLGDTPSSLRNNAHRYLGRTTFLEVPLSLPDIEEPRTRKELKTFKLLSLGRLHPQKNYPELIDAVGDLRQRGFDVSLTIAGEGPQRKEIEHKIAARHLGEHVHLKGLIADKEELRRLRRDADIYVQPSVHEGFCIAFAEALAAGMPVVARSIGGMRDYGRDGVNMLNIQGTSANDIAEPLAALMSRYSERAHLLSREAILTARQHFSPETVQAKWRAANEVLLTPTRPILPSLNHFVARLGRHHSLEHR